MLTASNSRIRSQVIGDGPPRVSGHTTYRSVIPTEKMPEDLRWNAATLWAGPKCHIVHYPLKGWKVFNLVVTYHNDVTEAVCGGTGVKKTKCVAASSTSILAARQVIEHGEDWKLWCCAIATRTKAGSTVAWRCSAMPPIQCCSILHKVPVWPWRTRSALHILLVSTGRITQRCELIATTGLQEPLAYRWGPRLIGDHIYHPTAAGCATQRCHGTQDTDEWYDDWPGCSVRMRCRY